MPKHLKNVLLALALGTLLTACATGGASPALLADEAPWWEEAGPCRVWVPIQPAPGRTPAWDPGPSTTRMSNAGDCRALGADMPDGAVLISTR